MEKMAAPLFSVSGFLASVNQTLEYAYQAVAVEGEVSGLKVNQGKYVFFDLKDADGTLSCFMTVWQMRMPIEDGMKLIISAQPKVTPWGKFSLTVSSYRPSGEGSLKKSFELLKAKLDKEGLFSPERKRPLPTTPKHIAVISSTQAAGYADFIKIINERWGGLEIEVAHTQVQGMSAADQMIRALKHFNTQDQLAEVVVMIRGGGSLDDLAAFNDEQLVREIAASRIPVLTGIGHEVDVSLADLAADLRAATPSSAAQLLVPDRREVTASLRQTVRSMALRTEQAANDMQREATAILQEILVQCEARINDQLYAISRELATLAAYDPLAVLGRGYAILRGEATKGSQITIETLTKNITAEVIDVKSK